MLYNNTYILYMFYIILYNTLFNIIKRNIIYNLYEWIKKI